MAVTGYFLDKDCNYCEVLLGFEHHHGSHTGAYLSEIVIQILQEHGIADRMLSVTQIMHQKIILWCKAFKRWCNLKLSVYLPGSMHCSSSTAQHNINNI